MIAAAAPTCLKRQPWRCGTSSPCSQTQETGRDKLTRKTLHKSLTLLQAEKSCLCSALIFWSQARGERRVDFLLFRGSHGKVRADGAQRNTTCRRKGKKEINRTRTRAKLSRGGELPSAARRKDHIPSEKQLGFFRICEIAQGRELWLCSRSCCCSC